MQLKRGALLACVALFLSLSSSAIASDMNPFAYAGNQSTLLGLMENDAGNGASGSGVFASAGFGEDMVNIFLADLSGAADLGMRSAGVTLFVMWGNGNDPRNDYWASVGFNNNYIEGTDGSFTDGVSEIFALGEGVGIVDGNISFGSAEDGDGGVIHNGTATPRGFAITNLQNMSAGELLITFDLLGGSIQDVGLFNYGDGTPEMLYGDLSIPLPLLMVPIPPPLGLAIAGFIGVVVLRRRICQNS